MTAPAIELRITKYDPAKRASDGRYLADDWTGFADVARGRVSRVDYDRVEDAYVMAAQLLLAENDVTELRVDGIENPRGYTPAPPSSTTLEDLPNLMRPVLREEFWAKFQSDTAFVHIGYDFYMYLGVPKASDAALSRIEAMGLFVEGFTSPYLPREDDT